MCCSSQRCSRRFLARFLTVCCLVCVASFFFSHLSIAAWAGPAGIESSTGSAFAPLAVASPSAKSNSWVARSAAVVFVMTLAGGGYFLWKRNRRYRRTSSRPHGPAPSQISAHGAKSSPAPSKPVQQPKLRFSMNAPKPAKVAGKPVLPTANGQNGHANGSDHGRNGSKRRRVFNYHKFYTEMVLQVSPATRADSFDSFPFEVMAYPRNGSQTNGDHNGHSATNGNGHDAVLKSSSPVASGAMQDAHSEMIANQQNLINEQTRLIEEQSKLITEKSRLIAEKNQLLARQSEMLNNQLL